MPTNAKHNNTNKKIAYIQNILSKFGISHEDDFNFSIENGLNMEGQKINKKENPSIKFIKIEEPILSDQIIQPINLDKYNKTNKHIQWRENLEETFFSNEEDLTTTFNPFFFKIKNDSFKRKG